MVTLAGEVGDINDRRDGRYRGFWRLAQHPGHRYRVRACPEISSPGGQRSVTACARGCRHDLLAVAVWEEIRFVFDKRTITHALPRSNVGTMADIRDEAHVPAHAYRCMR